MKFKKINLSIAICTYNRAEELKLTLSTLTKCHRQNIVLELIIIDDASTDNTDNVVAEFKEKYLSIKVIYIKLDKNINLGQARTIALSSTTNNIIWFIDDDVILPRKWLYSVKNILNNHQDKALVGGPVLPIFINRKHKPLWWSKVLEHGYAYAYLNYGKKAKLLHLPESLITANMGINKRILKENAHFNKFFGSDYQGLILGEDTELNWRVDQKGYKIFYSPEVYVHHMIPKWKISMKYINKKSSAWGKTECHLYFQFKLNDIFTKEFKNKIKVLFFHMQKYFLNTVYYFFYKKTIYLQRKYMHSMEITYSSSFLYHSGIMLFKNLVVK